MQGFWVMRGYSTEGRSLVRSSLMLAAVQASDLAQAHALYVGAALAESQSDYAEARQMLETCLALRRALGNPVEIAATLSTLSLVRLKAGDAVGADVGEREALQIFRQLGDRIGEAIGLLHLGQICLSIGDDAQALSNLGQCLTIAREVRNLEIEGECELLLGEVAFEGGDPTRAHLRFMRSLSVCSEDGDKRGEANALWWLGKAALQGGEIAVARARLGDALQAFRAFEMREELLGCLEDHAALAHAEGSIELAVRIAAAASKTRERLGLVRPPRSEQRWQGQVEALRRAMPSPALDAAWDEGSGANLEETIRAAQMQQAALVAA
jgi:tetratricopeptide (TPR) repeat protein